MYNLDTFFLHAHLVSSTNFQILYNFLETTSIICTSHIEITPAVCCFSTLWNFRGTICNLSNNILQNIWEHRKPVRSYYEYKFSLQQIEIKTQGNYNLVWSRLAKINIVLLKFNKLSCALRTIDKLTRTALPSDRSSTENGKYVKSRKRHIESNKYYITRVWNNFRKKTTTAFFLFDVIFTFLWCDIWNSEIY